MYVHVETFVLPNNQTDYMRRLEIEITNYT